MKTLSNLVDVWFGVGYTLVLIDILQATLLADPLKLPPEFLQFQCFQSLDFFAFLEELFLFTSFPTFSRFLARCVLATDGGGEVAWMTDDFCRTPAKRANAKKSVTIRGVRGNNVRFLETEVIRALEGVRNIVEFVLVLDQTVLATVGFRLGRTTGGVCNRTFLVFRARSFGLALAALYARNFSVCWEPLCTPINPPSVQDVAAGKRSWFLSGVRKVVERTSSETPGLPFLYLPWSSTGPSSYLCLCPSFSSSCPHHRMHSREYR